MLDYSKYTTEKLWEMLGIRYCIGAVLSYKH